MVNETEEVDSAVQEPCFSFKQLARLYDNSESYWRREVAKGRLRIIKLGASTRIPKTALDEYLGKYAK